MKLFTVVKSCVEYNLFQSKQEAKMKFKLLCILFVSFVVLQQWSKRNELGQYAPDSPINKSYETPKLLPIRGEIQDMLRHAKPEDVIAKFGTPANTQSGYGGDYWYYRNISRDDISGNVDDTVQIVFDNGEVNHINFN